MSRVGNYDYYMKLGFMVNELGLKNTELEVYAIIYSFSKDGNHWFSGSQQYLCDWTNKGKSAIQSALNSLVEKELIIKDEYFTKNNVKYCEYCVNLAKLNFTQEGYSENQAGIVKTTVNNNTTTNNNTNNISNIINNENQVGGLKKSECLEIFLTKYQELYNTKYTDEYAKMYKILENLNKALGEKDYTVLSQKLIEWMEFWKRSDWQREEGNFILGAVTQHWIRNKLDSKVPKNPKSKFHDESDLSYTPRNTNGRK